MPEKNESRWRELKEQQEALRWRMWDPHERWQALLSAISWVERQGKVDRNRPEVRLAEERRKLQEIGYGA